MYDIGIKQCIQCEKPIMGHVIPYGIVWLCSCGNWQVMFYIDGGLTELQNGDEERAMRYIAKIGKTLG